MSFVVDPKQFHLSISKELNALQDRVRSLIGSVHWGEEGRYKEAVLRNVIKRFLTPDVIVGTGFVVKRTSEGLVVSSQIDILIVSRNYPLLFSEGDFIITTPHNVLAMIEVKTDLSPSDKETFIKASDNGKLIGNGIFNGIFSFEDTTQASIEGDSFEETLLQMNGEVNHICLGKNYFVKHWDRFVRNPIKDAYVMYELENLAYSYFISNLVESLYPNTGMEREWFLYPIVEGKEEHKLKTVKLTDNI